MEENYFKILSIVYGIIMVLKLPLVHLFPEKWNQFELEIAYTKDKPHWVWIVGFFGLSLVFFTWYKFFTLNLKYSIIPTILLTITLLKLFQITLNYHKFRGFAEDVTTKRRSVLLGLNLLTFVVGLSMIGLGIFLF